MIAKRLIPMLFADILGLAGAGVVVVPDVPAVGSICTDQRIRPSLRTTASISPAICTSDEIHPSLRTEDEVR